MPLMQVGGRVVLIGILGIGWVAPLAGCSGSEPSAAVPPVASPVAAKEGADLGRLEELGVQVIPILGTPASPAHTQVFAEGSRLHDEDLGALRTIDDLEYLHLDGIPVSDAGLASLSGLKGLRSLYLERTRITDAGLKALEPLQGLTILDVAHTAVGDSGLLSIAHLGKLAGLDLTDTRITDAGVPALTPLGRLEVLRFSKTAVTDAGLKTLSTFRSLKSLSLDGCAGVHGRGLQALAMLPDLQVVVLNGTPLDDDGIAALATLEHLPELFLEDTPVGDAELARLGALTSLRKIYLGGTRCTEKGVKALAARLPNVEITLKKLAPPKPSAPPRAPAAFERVADVVYGWKHGMALTMDVIKPRRAANGAAVVWPVGDSFYSRRESITPEIPWMDELLRRGYHVFAVTHGSTPQFNVEEATTDLHRAVRFIRHNARSYGLDPQRIGAAGRSGCGYLALMLGTSDGRGWHFEDPIARGALAVPDPVEDESSQVRAVASFYAPTDWRNYGRRDQLVTEHPTIGKLHYFGPFALHEFDEPTTSYRTVTEPARVREWLGRVSPVSHVSKSAAPVLLFQGEKDENVPLQQATAMADALRSAGVPCDLNVKSGAGHGWPYDPADMIQVADWFDRHLKSGQ